MKFYTWDEIKKKKLIVIDNKVYDVSKFKYDHPGGDFTIEQWEGKDCSKIFEEVGHSKRAREILKTLYIGEIDMKTSGKNIYKYSVAISLLIALLSIIFGFYKFAYN